jgi:hypothetical protein
MAVLNTQDKVDRSDSLLQRTLRLVRSFPVTKGNGEISSDDVCSRTRTNQDISFSQSAIGIPEPDAW